MSKYKFSPRGERLVNQVLRLDWEEQLDISDMLASIHSCPPGVLSEDDPNFESILMERLRQYESGECKGISGEDFFRELDEKYEFKFAKRNGRKYPVWMKAIRERCVELGSKLSNYYEDDFQIEFCEALLKDGYTAIREYPFPDRSGWCDLALVSADDCRAIESWIEFKPVPLANCHYWRPSKFFEGQFKHDVRKLAALAGGEKYFLVFAETHSPTIFDDVRERPRYGEELQIQHMAWAISKWAGGIEPVELEAFATSSESYGHLLIWPVTDFVDHELRIDADGRYDLIPFESASRPDAYIG